MPINFSTVDRMRKVSATSFYKKSGATTEQVQAIADALDAVLLGSDVRAVDVVETVVDGGNSEPPTNVNADRQTKLLMRLQDTVTGRISTHEIGTFDRAQLPTSDSDTLDLTAGTGLALKTAIEAAVDSINGNPVILLSAQEVSRTG